MSDPWKDVPIWKDEKAYLDWLRSQTRRIWTKHPVKIAYRQSLRYKAPIGVKGKEVWVCDCEICGKQSRNTQTDHIVPGGSFNDWESYTEWAKRILWVSFDDIRELCKECHDIVSHSQNKGMTFEEAKKDKQLIAKCNQPVATQKEELLKLGYTASQVSNKEKRRECYREVLNGHI